VQCSQVVKIQTSGGGGGGGSSRPSCKLTASDKTIDDGDSVTLTWDNSRTNDIILEDSRGNVLVDTDTSSKYDEDEDSIVVTPDRDTTYTLTAIRGSRERECTVDIEVGGVSVSSTRSQDPLVAGISLSNVPYTGFEAGPLLTTMFYTLLALWALGMAYVLVLRRNPMVQSAVASAGLGRIIEDRPLAPLPSYTAPLEKKETQVYESTVAETEVPFNLPTVAYEAPAVVEETPLDVTANSEFDDEIALLENKAHDESILLSSDAIRFILGQTGDQEERLTLLQTIMDHAKATYPREDGWIVINKERIVALFA